MCAEINISSREAMLNLLFQDKFLGNSTNLQLTTSFDSNGHQLDNILIEFILNDQDSNDINVINLFSSKNKNSNERTNCQENCSNVFESQFNYSANERLK